MSAKVIRVIETGLEVRGDGRDIPLRRIVQYWSEKGELLAEVDSWCGRYEMDRIERAARGLLDVITAKNPGGGPEGYIDELRKALGREGLER